MYSWIVHSLTLIFRFIIVITRETEQLEKLGVVLVQRWCSMIARKKQNSLLCFFHSTLRRRISSEDQIASQACRLAIQVSQEITRRRSSRRDVTHILSHHHSYHTNKRLATNPSS
jgi:hypothetical protein